MKDWATEPMSRPKKGSFDAISPWERSNFDLFSERLSQIAVSNVTMICLVFDEQLRAAVKMPAALNRMLPARGGVAQRRWKRQRRCCGHTPKRPIGQCRKLVASGFD